MLMLRFNVRSFQLLNMSSMLIRGVEVLDMSDSHTFGDGMSHR